MCNDTILCGSTLYFTVLTSTLTLFCTGYISVGIKCLTPKFLNCFHATFSVIIFLKSIIYHINSSQLSFQLAIVKCLSNKMRTELCIHNKIIVSLLCVQKHLLPHINSLYPFLVRLQKHHCSFQRNPGRRPKHGFYNSILYCKNHCLIFVTAKNHLISV